MCGIIDIIKRYWLDDKTNIFKNCFDAIFGSVCIIILPALSLITVIGEESFNWSNYTFPCFAICCAGLYDTYGRYDYDSPKNVKLAIRAIINLLVMLLVCLFTNTSSKILALSPIIILFVCGLGILSEVIRRVNVAIKISEWGSVRKEDK